MNAIDDNALLAAITRLSGKVLVVGDVMLDVYAYGATHRISPEAPIPVMRLENEAWMLGGAGNVARNIASLGGEVVLVGVTGSDASGDAIESLIESEPAIENRILRVVDRHTTVKRRFVVDGQQMLRVDREDTIPLAAEDDIEIINRVEEACSSSNAIVISDYGKGTVSVRLIAAAAAAARSAGLPLLIDPKHPDTRRYAGATTITPNARELALSTGMTTDSDADVEAAARSMIARSGAEFLVVTRSAKGICFVPAVGQAVHLPARRREVFDVAGAGDTVVGIAALAVGSGISPSIAAALANLAAGIVVGKAGTATCSVSELELDLVEASLRLGTKLQVAGRAARLIEQWRQGGYRVGFTNGCFDLLHPGHVSLLTNARAQCDRLVVGLNSDESVRRLKGPTRPLQTQASRAAVLSALSSVDIVVIFDADTPLALIERLRPAVLFKGADYTLDKVVGSELVISYGGEVKLIELVDGHSTTNIVSRLG